MVSIFSMYTGHWTLWLQTGRLIGPINNMFAITGIGWCLRCTADTVCVFAIVHWSLSLPFSIAVFYQMRKKKTKPTHKQTNNICAAYVSKRNHTSFKTCTEHWYERFFMCMTVWLISQQRPASLHIQQSQQASFNPVFRLYDLQRKSLSHKVEFKNSHISHLKVSYDALYQCFLTIINMCL